MQTNIRSLEETKQLTAGAMLPFNVNCFGVIRDLLLEFSNAGAPATLANVQASIDHVTVLLNGVNIIDVPFSELVDLNTYLGTRIQQSTLVNVFSLNIGRLLYQAGIMRDEFAWRCGKKGETDPNKKISSLVVQIFPKATLTNVTDVSLYSIRKEIEADFNDSYIQFNANTQSFAATGQHQVNTLPKNANDMFLLAIAYPGGGAISGGETLVNNKNITRNISTAVNNHINQQEGYGVISGAFVHNYCDGMGNSGLYVSDITSELSVRTTFSTAPAAGNYDLSVVKIHNCPQRIIDMNQSNNLFAIDQMTRAQ